MLLTPPSYSNPVALSNQLVNAFEPNDQRFTNWIGSFTDPSGTYYYPYKYKISIPDGSNPPPSEYQMMLRLGEQYLIRAEAEANGAGNGLPGAVTDLNTIRTRAGLPAYSGTADQPSLMTAIMHERRVELFTELGQRWLDLKRTGTIDAVMSVVAPLKGGTWSSYKALYPIPQSDIQEDHNLVQNRVIKLFIHSLFPLSRVTGTGEYLKKSV